MQLCQLRDLAHSLSSEQILVYGVSGDNPFVNQAFSEFLQLGFDCLTDPTLACASDYVGLLDEGVSLLQRGITPALRGFLTSGRGCVIIDPEGNILYSFVEESVVPPIEEIKLYLTGPMKN